MPIRITRINPRSGHVERPWRNRDGVFVLGDPAHGAQKHHDKFAVKVGTMEEVAALVARGFSLRMTDGETPPSLIAPDSLVVESVEDADEATLYAEMAPKPPFTKEEMMEELKLAMLVQANQIAHAGSLEFALAFMGYEPENATYPYTDGGKTDRVDLQRFAATAYLDRAYEYAFQVGRHHLFGGDTAQDVQEFIAGANPQSNDGIGSPLANPDGKCRQAADTGCGRWKLGEGYDLSVRELALLARMTEPAVRNSLSKERIAIGKDGVDNIVAAGWLRQRRDFIPTRTQEARHENQLSWSRFALDREPFRAAFHKIMNDQSITKEALATKAKVAEPFLDALLAGKPIIDLERLQRVGEALELDVPHFAGVAIQAALRLPGKSD